MCIELKTLEFRVFSKIFLLTLLAELAASPASIINAFLVPRTVVVSVTEVGSDPAHW